ncbi:MAG: putative metalloprotease CJM1_0395 family protein [Candidatus Methylomirabilia bacterium]
MTIAPVLHLESILPGLASEPTREQAVPGLSPQAEAERREDRVELSEAGRALVAAAKSLPRQGQVDSGGAVHGLAASEAQVEAADPQAVQVEGVEIPDLRALAGASGKPESDAQGVGEGDEERKANPTAEKTASGRELSEEEQAEVEQLKERDREVRAHEQAHVVAGGRYVRGGIQFEYEIGPDGRRYAVGGEVSIDTSPVPEDPEATLQKAETIRRAALAPAQPSGQDRRAAAAASRMEAEARQELLVERLEEDEAEGPGPASEAEAQGLEAGGKTGGSDAERAGAEGDNGPAVSDGTDEADRAPFPVSETPVEHAARKRPQGVGGAGGDDGPPGGLDGFTPAAMGPVIRLEYGVRPGQVVDVYG